MMPMIVQEVMLSGNVEETRKLLNSEIVNANMFGLTLLHIASENGLSDMVELLIELGAEINAQESFSSLLTSASQSTPSFSKQTPLHMAAHVGSVDVTKVLLRHGADVNCLDQLLRTPLHVALEQGHIEVAEKLMSGGADVNAMSKHGKTPLHIAAKCGRLTVVHALIKAGAVVNVNIQGEYGSTPLHIATEFRHVDVVRVLLDEGANVDCRSQYGRTPLHIASECGKLEIVTALLRKGADVNCRDEYGRTPLHIACKRGQNNVIPVLLEHGADAMIRFNDLTQWSYGFPEIIDTLERHFIKVDAVRQATGGPDGEWTPHNGIWSQQRRNEFLRECLQELATLNQTIGETDFTYTDLLLRKVPAMRDLDVELCLLDGHVLQKFPIYGRMIDIRFQAGRRWRLLARAVALFYGVGDFAKLPSTLVAIICGYLRDRDLELITTFWKSTISFPGSVKS